MAVEIPRLGSINYIKLDTEAISPVYSTEEAAGADLFSIENVVIWPGQTKMVRTGIAIALPVGTAGLILPRSGLAAKHGITVLNSPGLIDSDYRGELKVLLHNTNQTPTPGRHGETHYEVEKGSRIAQLVVQEVLVPSFQLVASLDETVRGTGGYGSTGY